MTDKQLKLIYDYMKEAGWRMLWDSKLCPLDSNSAWECVQEMDKRDDWVSFIVSSLSDDGDGTAETYYDIDSIKWIMKPSTFFNCFSKFLEGKDNGSKA